MSDFKPWQGRISGVDYFVENLGDIARQGRWVASITVWMDAGGKLLHPLEINARDGKQPPPRPEDPRSIYIEELLALGSEYIDLGYNTDWLAAEFNADRVKMTPELAQQAAELLLAIRERSLPLPPPQPPAYRPG